MLPLPPVGGVEGGGGGGGGGEGAVSCAAAPPHANKIIPEISSISKPESECVLHLLAGDPKRVSRMTRSAVAAEAPGSPIPVLVIWWFRGGNKAATIFRINDEKSELKFCTKQMRSRTLNHLLSSLPRAFS